MGTVNFESNTGGGFHKNVGARTPKAPRFVGGTFDFDASYPTGGEDISDIIGAFPTKCQGCVFETDGTRLFVTDYTNETVKAFSALGTEVTNATDLSAVTGVRFFAWGF